MVGICRSSLVTGAHGDRSWSVARLMATISVKEIPHRVLSAHWTRIHGTSRGPVEWSSIFRTRTRNHSGPVVVPRRCGTGPVTKWRRLEMWVDNLSNKELAALNQAAAVSGRDLRSELNNAQGPPGEAPGTPRTV